MRLRTVPSSAFTFWIERCTWKVINSILHAAIVRICTCIGCSLVNLGLVRHRPDLAQPVYTTGGGYIHGSGIETVNNLTTWHNISFDHTIPLFCTPMGKNRGIVLYTNGKTGQDQIQKLFLDKLKEFNTKSKAGRMSMTPEVAKQYKDETERLRRVYRPVLFSPSGNSSQKLQKHGKDAWRYFWWS